MTDFKRVFVDTAPIIYYLENSPLYSEVIKRFFTTCIEENIQVVTSAITIEEYLVYPYSSGQMDFVDNFKRFLDYMNVEIIDINYDIAEQASKLRGQYKGFKAMDALQISSAIASVPLPSACYIRLHGLHGPALFQNTSTGLLLLRHRIRYRS